ncbi:hypothetical protein CC2G_008020 [Coprinopsis cinerea AmutBmut pab1-1]|nr:hypothetical protein CC2G_008020 [Coprinopsis cinerea AmutBmut pab1-1]
MISTLNGAKGHSALAIALLFLALVSPAVSQDRPPSLQFRWRFTDPSQGASLPTCSPLGITVETFDPDAGDTFGIEPFYMIAYEVEGTPQTSLIGTDNRTLEYTVTHPVGSRLILNVVDSTASGGGIPPQLYTVVEGDSTDCVVSPPSDEPEFIVWTNVTEVVPTCTPLTFAIDGGVPPYSLSIAALDSFTVTNVTIPAGFDAFTWINRAAPSSQLAISVSDANGRWATGTPFLTTAGSTDTECDGRENSNGTWESLGLVRPDRPQASGSATGSSSSGTPRPTAGNSDTDSDEDDETSGGKKNNVGLVVGVTVPLVALLLGGIEKGVSDDEESPANGPSNITITPFNVDDAASTPSSGPTSAGTVTTKQRDGLYSATSPTSYSGSLFHGTSEGASSDVFSTRPVVNETVPTRQPKASEAALSSVTGSSSDYTPTTVSVRSGPSGQEIVIQHRDGGIPTISELPPPYVDQRRQE